MHNGISLKTARGSDTNGHVQTNKFFIKPRSSPAGGPPKAPAPASGLDDAGGMRKPSKEILEHDRKRQVELRLLLLRDALEEQGYTEGEVEERVEEARMEAEEEGHGAGRRPLPGKGERGHRHGVGGVGVGCAGVGVGILVIDLEFADVLEHYRPPWVPPSPVGFSWAAASGFR
uniref:CWF21 domain-containing protein n=1 Tax=Oryza rufipogon TaxID=4529 RepID=A0A0E0R4S6_ORYRU